MEHIFTGFNVKHHWNCNRNDMIINDKIHPDLILTSPNGECEIVWFDGCLWHGHFQNNETVVCSILEKKNITQFDNNLGGVPFIQKMKIRENHMKILNTLNIRALTFHQCHWDSFRVSDSNSQNDFLTQLNSQFLPTNVTSPYTFMSDFFETKNLDPLSPR